MVLGVLYVTNTPIELPTSYPPRPKLVTVGTPGATAEGFALVTAKALNLPDFTCGIPDGALANDICTSPSIRAASDCAAPLYWTRTISIFAMDFSNSAARWPELPVEAVPKLSCPGLALARAIKSFSDPTGSAGLTRTSEG